MLSKRAFLLSDIIIFVGVVAVCIVAAAIFSHFTKDKTQSDTLSCPAGTSMAVYAGDVIYCSIQDQTIGFYRCERSGYGRLCWYLNESIYTVWGTHDNV